MLEDVSISALHTALDGLSQRQNAISANIANVNTPYYRERGVAFEGALQQALALEPDDSDTHRYLGAIYSQLGRWEEANEVARRFIAQPAAPLSLRLAAGAVMVRAAGSAPPAEAGTILRESVDALEPALRDAANGRCGTIRDARLDLD